MAKAALVAVALALALGGCTHGGAAKLQGQIAAGVTMPEWPEECRRQEAHADLKRGVDIRVILKRERMALERQNVRAEVCARFYDELRVRLGNAD